MVVANDTVSVKVILKKSINIVYVYNMMVWGMKLKNVFYTSLRGTSKK